MRMAMMTTTTTTMMMIIIIIKGSGIHTSIRLLDMRYARPQIVYI